MNRNYEKHHIPCRSYLRLTPDNRIALIFSAKNQPPNHHFCMEKIGSRTFMKWLRPKAATNAKVTSGNVYIFLTPSNPWQSFKPSNVIKTGFLFSFEDSEFSLLARDGRSARRKNSENFFQSREKFFTNRSRHLLFFKTSFQYCTAVS